MTVFRRMWDSPKLIQVLSVLTVIALAGAAFAVFGVMAQDDARERDRIAADLSSCSRGNRLRGDVKNIGAAAEALVAGILDEILAGARDTQAVTDLRARLEPLFVEHRRAVDAVEIVDCERVTNGARITTTTTEAP